jgi:hypothetical protein
VHGLKKKVDENQLSEYIESRFGKVVEISLARDNGKLITLAMKRGELVKQMESLTARKFKAEGMGASVASVGSGVDTSQCA